MNRYRTSVTVLQQDWNELAVLDPFWAVLSDRTKQFNGWRTDDFFATGAAEIVGVMKVAAELGYPAEHRRALDFGCGIGRLTRALENYFDSCTGVDISTEMIARAKELNPRSDFVLSCDRDLSQFPDRHFDMIYSNIVLQHQSSVDDVRYYIAAFLRMLKEKGLLVFQLPHYIPWRYRLLARRRLYQAFRAVGVQPRVLYRSLHLDPIRMLAIPQQNVLDMIASSGARALRVIHDRNGGPKVESRTYFVTRA